MVTKAQRRISGISASEDYKQYFLRLEEMLRRIVAVAKECRSKGFDPSLDVEVLIAWDMAERVEELTGPRGVAKRIRALGSKMTRIQMALQITQEIIYGRFGHLAEQDGAKQALRTALAIINEGMTVAPIQGIFDVKIKDNRDGTQYLAIYFSAPTRSLGGTAQALIVIIADFVRRLLHLDRYKPDTREVRRFIEEVRWYERKVGGLRFHASDEELLEALRNLPVEVTGAGIGPEVTSFRDLTRVETNRIRSGAVRVVNDIIIGQARKMLEVAEELDIEGWNWLKSVGASSKGAGMGEKEIVGRPFFSTSLGRSGFRLRYGRARNTGLGAVGVHPATMILLDNFIAIGTQLRVDCPGKSATVASVDLIEGPLIKLDDGSVVRVESEKAAREMAGRVNQIIFLGDILIAYGDFLFNNRPLLPSSFTEQWWIDKLYATVRRSFESSIEKMAEEAGIDEERLRSFIRGHPVSRPTAEEDVKIAHKFHLPLHPRHTFFWSSLSLEELSKLRTWLLNARTVENGMVISYQQGGKALLERLCLQHFVKNGTIVIPREEATILRTCLALDKSDVKIEGHTTLEGIQNLSGVIVEDAARSFVGARMGRPERAEKGKMNPTAHVLFPLGSAGGTQRNILKAARKGGIVVNVANFVCPKCDDRGLMRRCPSCGAETVIEMRCPHCGSRSAQGRVCPVCRTEMRPFSGKSIELEKALSAISDQLGFLPTTLRGVNELTSRTKIPENLVKGVLRAKYDLPVYKDGSVRFNTTNAPLTHFKPVEIGTSIGKLRELGYTVSRFGDPLCEGDQICELKVQDVILPEKCGEYLVSVANFVDELLRKVYEMPSFYNAKKKEDLIGHLIVGLCPHTSCGVLGRIIGYTRACVSYAHPLWHAAKRGDCDGDEDSLMLALDVMLNLSRYYLPDKTGGSMDVPLLLMPMINPEEVDEVAHCLDVSNRYPEEFYERTSESREPKGLADVTRVLGQRVGRKSQFERFYYTTETTNIAKGNLNSTYKKLATITKKLEAQLNLAEKIAAVDSKDVGRRILTAHFLKDITGNLRKFASQGFRCKVCNARLRRIPLNARCPKCGSERISQTVFRGNIERYFKSAIDIVKRYNIGAYYQGQLGVIDSEIRILFGKRREQARLTEFS